MHQPIPWTFPKTECPSEGENADVPFAWRVRTVLTYTGYTPLRRQFDGEMVAAFQVDHPEWKSSRDILFAYEKGKRDVIYYIAPSAVSAMIVWAAVSQTRHPVEEGKDWGKRLEWRAKQPVPPLEPAPWAPMKTAVAQVLPEQLRLFDA
jgi:hypothetical protein